MRLSVSLTPSVSTSSVQSDVSVNPALSATHSQTAKVLLRALYVCVSLNVCLSSHTSMCFP